MSCAAAAREDWLVSLMLTCKSKDVSRPLKRLTAAGGGVCPGS
jgi:hypothetical protein